MCQEYALLTVQHWLHFQWRQLQPVPLKKTIMLSQRKQKLYLLAFERLTEGSRYHLK